MHGTDTMNQCGSRPAFGASSSLPTIELEKQRSTVPALLYGPGRHRSLLHGSCPLLLSE